jgi:hypothetical protein
MATDSVAGARPAVAVRGRQPLIVAVAAGALVAATMFIVSSRSNALARGGAVAASPARRDIGDAASRPPDISAMSPRERAERLYDRAMRAQQSGKTDSARFFATMATLAYGQIGESTLDDHYDLGRLALLAGQTSVASAEADTILEARPTHLLGLMLAEDAARAAGAEVRASAAHVRLLASANAERTLQLPEYLQHATEIAALLGDAPSQSGAAVASAPRAGP